MTTLVGYRINRERGLEGEAGSLYDYVLAGNGLFLRASNPLLGATIAVAPAEGRGLAPLTEKLTLAHGRIPWRLLEPTLAFLTGRTEVYLGVVWQDGAYQKVIPEQTGHAGSVQYQRPKAALLDVYRANPNCTDAELLTIAINQLEGLVEQIQQVTEHLTARREDILSQG